MENHERVSRVPTEPEGNVEGKKDGAGRKKVRKPWTRLRKIGVGVLVVGALVLVAGVGFLVYNLVKTPGAGDAEYLVEVGQWQREDAPSVVWEFTEIGEGKLSTNGGENVYDFVWAFKDGKLEIDTDWLYELNDEYEFEIDQGVGKFRIVSGDETIEFVEK